MKKNKSNISKVLNIIFTVIFIVWVIMLLIDYLNVSKHKEATFCISHELKKYTDGSVEICNGLGYKVYKYNRDNYKAIEFGPFWLEEKDTTIIK